MDIRPGSRGDATNFAGYTPDEDTALDRADLASNPLDQFQQWFAAAHEAGMVEPNAMTLSTASPEGVPTSRTVLLKGVDDQGFVFFTNYESHKAQELAANPFAALVFYWQPLSRQIRVTGTVERLPAEDSEAYYRTRHRGSRIGAWASPQSTVIPDREYLEARVAELEERYPGDEIPLPPHWGGYRVYPKMIEFWQGRQSRLHDRFRYTKAASGEWTIDRLAP